MSERVTVNGLDYTLSKLDNGSIVVEHSNRQYNPMHGPDTEGVHAFEVHPCQRSWYAFWNRQLPSSEQTEGQGRGGAEPWWSLRSARTDTATRTLIDQQGRKPTGKKRSGGRSPQESPQKPVPESVRESKEGPEEEPVAESVADSAAESAAESAEESVQGPPRGPGPDLSQEPAPEAPPDQPEASGGPI